MMTKTSNPAADARLVTATYLVALLTLLINDHLLKGVYGGALTGKLSDFAGLFALGLFASAIAPRHARAICCVIAVLFTVWKSPLSQPAIEGWNATFALQIDRVVDYSDLAALVVLPFAVSAAEAARRAASSRVATLLVAVVSFVAFTATSVASYSADVPADPQVRLIADSRSIEQFAQKLESCGLQTYVFTTPTDTGPQTSMTIGLRTDTTDPERDVSLLGTVHETDGGVTIELETINIIRQTTPIEVDPYVVEATRRIRKCLGAKDTQ